MTGILIDAIQRQKCRNNFKNFLYVVFKYINLPSPTEIQYAIADELQHRESDLILNGFRGIAKSTITGIYDGWLLDRDPENTQIIYVGANFEEAKKFIKFTRGLLEVVPFLNYLIPDKNGGQRDNATMFDVRPAGLKVQPSCKAVGIFGNLTGNRATHIIADDIETSDNCDTQIKREHIESQVTEFRQIVQPLRGNLLFLGTPHTELSIYNKLHNKGIPTAIFPIKYPTEQQQEKYGNKLASYIVNKIQQDSTLIDTPTDPLRFNEEDILKLEAEGRSKFAMQQMLDTTLSDLERYPLKCSDLVVIDCDKEIAPEKVAYGSSPNLAIKDLACNGIGTDRYYAPIPIPDIKWVPYTFKAMAIDPSGRGKDELAYSIGGVLNSQIFLLKQGGLQGGYTEENLTQLATMAKEHKVNKITIESNFGDGMFTALFLPVLRKIGYQCKVEEVRHNTQKERRIIDTLEPVMNQHRLIVDKKLILDDADSIRVYPLEKQQQYSLFYQMTRITKDRGSLTHDDRLDCLAMLVAECLSMMSMDADEQIKQRLDDEYEKYIEYVFGDIDDPSQDSWFDI